MEFIVKNSTVDKLNTDCLVVAACKKNLPASTATIDTLTQGYLSKLLKCGDLDFKPGNSLMLFHTLSTPSDRLLLIAIGDDNKPLTEAEF